MEKNIGSIGINKRMTIKQFELSKQFNASFLQKLLQSRPHSNLQFRLAMYTYSNRMCKFCLALSRILNFFNALPFTWDLQTNLYILTPKQQLKFKRELFWSLCLPYFKPSILSISSKMEGLMKSFSYILLGFVVST